MCAPMRPDVLIVSRARDANHARHLYAARRHRCGAGDRRSELAALRSGAAGLGVPAGPVIASIHGKRDEIRHDLQEAARAAGT